jgi:hypothetical protein
MYYVGCMTKFYIMSCRCAYVFWNVIHLMASFSQKDLWNKQIYEWNLLWLFRGIELLKWTHGVYSYLIFIFTKVKLMSHWDEKIIKHTC